MSEKPVKPKDVVSLDVESNLQTTEGRVFLNQINKVSRVLYLKDTAVEFKGEQLLNTGYIADFKSVPSSTGPGSEPVLLMAVSSTTRGRGSR